MHGSVMDFLREYIHPEEIFGKDVLEVGSQDVNGSPREIIAPFGPRAYYGIDYGPGKGVDLVMDASRITTYFGRDRFDVVVSTEMLEHAENWKVAVQQMKEVLRPDGILFLTARGPGFPYHGFPHDHWRFTLDDFKLIFSDMKIDAVLQDIAPGVLIKARKTIQTGRLDLSNIVVEPMLPPEPAAPPEPDPWVDVMIATCNTLPWLKLLVSQLRRFPPEFPARLIVSDSGSTDGTAEWLSKNAIVHRTSERKMTHQESLKAMLEMSEAPYAAFMDVDAFPIAEGWLDDPISILKDRKVGAVGLWGHLPSPEHRKFVHPSFCVFRRDLYRKLGLTPDITYGEKIIFDVGELMSHRMELEGYRLEFVGANRVEIEDTASVNKVIHAISSTPVLSDDRVDRPFVEMVGHLVRWHRDLLSHHGVWEEFRGYCRESVSGNPRCGKYLEGA